MRLLIVVLLSVPAIAHAWSVAGLQYIYQQPAPQQPPQPSYSEQYNADYMDGYLNSHGYAGDSGHGPAYSEGYQSAWKAEHRQ